MENLLAVVADARLDLVVADADFDAVVPALAGATQVASLSTLHTAATTRTFGPVRLPDPDELAAEQVQRRPAHRGQ